ncbi:MAG TPA: hypothetical protein VEX69_03855 [Candidatus Limnocylindria bacterium]|nr:hypothetical protein [Candidatus Limnocylindria bacterium]
MKSSRASHFLAAFFLFGFVCNTSARAATSWTTHNDPSGFSVETPDDWHVSRDAASGKIVIQGQRGERTVIWPMFLERQQLDARGAAALLQQLARSVDGQMPWATPEGSANVVRVIAKTEQRNATAMLSWAIGTDGTSVYLYCVEAPPDVYRNSADAFIHILKSFHIVQDPSMRDAGAGSSGTGAPALNFVKWSDPHEGAFSVGVPQGWRVVGGAYRMTATDVRYGLDMSSPDGQVYARVGDANIPIYTQPTQMLAMAGLREGGYHMLGDGTKLEIRRYIQGQQYAYSYVDAVVRHQCSDLRIISNNARPDLAAKFTQVARNEGASSAQLTGGDAVFTCMMNGEPMQGKCIAVTALLAPGQSPMWAVYRLYGYLAAPGRQDDAVKVVTEAVTSWKFNPQWEAQQRSMANAAVQQDNARSQQIRSRALAAIAEDQRQTSEIITKGWEQRQKVYDEISRKRENAILGTLDVVDPQTGSRYKVSNYGDYHYMSNDNVIYSTNSANSPGPGLRELITLP